MKHLDLSKAPHKKQNMNRSNNQQSLNTVSGSIGVPLLHRPVSFQNQNPGNNPRNKKYSDSWMRKEMLYP